MRIIDLTHLLNSDITVYPGTEPPKFEQANTIAKDGFAELKFSMYTHCGTHMDAPAHMIPGSNTLDNLPPEFFFGKAICVDCTESGSIIRKNQLIKYESLIKQVDFVLIRTGWSEKWKSNDYFKNYPILSLEACKWLINYNLKGVGLDTISIDSMNSVNMENHMQILGKGMLIVENLTNLKELNEEIFYFSCLPLKIENADGSPIRAIALVDFINSNV